MNNRATQFMLDSAREPHGLSYRLLISVLTYPPQSYRLEHSQALELPESRSWV